MTIPQPTPPQKLLGAALLAAAAALGCATGPPPLDPELAPIAARAQAMDAALPQYEKIDGRLDERGDRSAFAAYFDGRRPVLIDESARSAAGDSRREYYYEGGELFYVKETTTPTGGGDPDELLLFFEGGRLVGSRKLEGNKLAVMDPSEVSGATDRAAALLHAANLERGPAYKIEFDLAAFDDLGLVGPPLRSVRYGFCIPSGGSHAEQVQEIDPSIEIGADTMRCGAGQQSAVGDTHQPAFRTVLLQLAELPYVESIRDTSTR